MKLFDSDRHIHMVDLMRYSTGDILLQTSCPEYKKYMRTIFKFNPDTRRDLVVNAWQCKCGTVMEATFGYIESELEALTALLDIRSMGKPCILRRCNLTESTESCIFVL